MAKTKAAAAASEATTSAKNDDECKALLTAFKFPFKN